MNFTLENPQPSNPDAHAGGSAKASKPVTDWGRWLFLTLMLLFLFYLGYRTVYNVAWNEVERTDYTVYRVAGQAVLDGTDIYKAYNVRGWFYVYPPPFAILMIPFAKLSLAWGSGLWYLLSLAGLASATVMAIYLAREALPGADLKPDPWTLYEIPLLLASPWLVSGLMRCQASEFMVWLMIAAIYFWWRGRPVLGGMSLAAAALIKAFPIALLAYFAWRRQWRFIGGFLLCLLLGGLILPALVYGWQTNLDYWQQWGDIVAGPALSANHSRQDNFLYAQLLDSLKPRNQSIEALLLTLQTPPQFTKPFLAAIALGMLGIMAYLAIKADAKAQLIVISAFVMWNLLIPPISETHYFGLLLLPLAVLTAIAQTAQDRFSRWLCVGALVMCFSLSLWANLVKEMELFRLLCWASLGIWASLLVLAQVRITANSMDSPSR